MRMHGGQQVLFRPVAADQSEKTGLFKKKALKGQALKWSICTGTE